MQAAYIAEPRDSNPQYNTIDYIGKPIVDEWTLRAKQMA
jgi:hypothetical protein